MFALPLATYGRILGAIREVMKKTLFTAMLAVALPGGGSALAATVVERYDEEHSHLPGSVYGAYAENADVSHGDLIVSASGQTEGYEKLESVYGGYTKGGLENIWAQGSRVDMTGGEVGRICGGYASTKGSQAYVSENTVEVSGGIVASVYGGFAQDEVSTKKVYYNMVLVSGGEVSSLFGSAAYGGSEAKAEHNTVIVTGGKVGSVYAGEAKNAGMMNVVNSNSIVVTGGSIRSVYASPGTISPSGGGLRVQENSMHLVGAGSSYSHEGETYEGHEMSISSVSVLKTSGASLYDNALDISGTGIQIGWLYTKEFAKLNFGLLADQITDTAPMVTITGENGFSISENLELSFDAQDNTEWKPGDSVTLVEAQQGMSIAPEALDKEYNIYQNGHPEILMATAKLVLEQGQGSAQFLKLVVPGNVPEPATGTLSLLALAALAARRRKK